MAIPVNIDAAHAIDIGDLSVPYSITQDANDSGITYPLWYKFTSTVQNELTLLGFGDLVTYKPFTSVYTPNSTTLFAHNTPNKAIQIPVKIGITYYFKFVTSTGNVSPAILHFSASLFTGTTTTFPSGSLFIPDPVTGFPLSVVDSTTGAVLNYIQDLPNGSQVDILDNNITLFEDNSGSASNTIKLSLRDANLAIISDINFTMPDSGWQTTYIRSNRVDKFYIGWEFDFDNDPINGHSSFRVVETDGTISGFTTLSTTGLTGLCPSNDDSILYYIGKNAPNDYSVKRWDLVNNLPLSDLAANIVGWRPRGAIIVLADDSIAVLYIDTSFFLNRKILIYSAVGALLHTYDYGDYDLFLAPDSDASKYWVYLGGNLAAGVVGVATIKKIDSSDGSTLVTLPNVIYDGGAYEPDATATPELFGISGDPGAQSTGLYVSRESVTPPTTGTLIITKATLPAGQPTSFTFTAGGGLSPTSFNLLDTESRQFDDVAPGSGYSIVETTDPNYTIDYDVSNGDPIDNISIAAGETVTVTVTNTRLPNKYSGIYKIVPNKTNDTLWTSFDPDETIDVKIPDPFIKTALIGS